MRVAFVDFGCESFGKSCSRNVVASALPLPLPLLTWDVAGDVGDARLWCDCAEACGADRLFDLHCPPVSGAFAWKAVVSCGACSAGASSRALLAWVSAPGARGGEADSRSAWLRIKCLPLTLA